MRVLSRSKALESKASALAFIKRLVFSHSSVIVRHAEAMTEPKDNLNIIQEKKIVC